MVYDGQATIVNMVEALNILFSVVYGVRARQTENRNEAAGLSQSISFDSVPTTYIQSGFRAGIDFN